MSKKIMRAQRTCAIHIPSFPIPTSDANIALKCGAKEMFPDNTLGEPLRPIDSNCYYVDFSDLFTYCNDVGKICRELASQCVRKGMRAFPAMNAVIIATPLDELSFSRQLHGILSRVRERAFDGKCQTAMIRHEADE